MVVWYPLYAWLLKTPLPTLAVLSVAAFSAARAGRRRAPRDCRSSWAPAALLLLAVCLLAYNYGVRYLIPVTSFLLVFAGGAYHVLGAGRRGRFIAAALGAWLVASVAHASPLTSATSTSWSADRRTASTTCRTPTSTGGRT